MADSATCEACGAAIRADALFCAHCGNRRAAMWQPPPGDCRHCGVSAGATRHCRNCGALINAQIQSPARRGGQALPLRSLAIVAGFMSALIGSFTAWVAAPGQAPTAFDEQTAYRVNDWLDVTDFPTDGLLVLGAAVAGLVVFEMGRRGRMARATVGTAILALGVFLLVVGVLEVHFIMTFDTGEEAASLDPGQGLYFVVLGAALVVASRWLPEPTGEVHRSAARAVEEGGAS